MSANVQMHQTEDAHVAPALNKIRSRLFLKYVGLFVAVVCVALVTNGIFELWISYRDHKESLIRIQHEQAEAAAEKISQFIKEIEGQLGWTTQLLWAVGAIDQRRFDALRLLRQVPAITELAQFDASGMEQIRVSRLAMDVVNSGLDVSKEPKFANAVKNKIYYGPVYFRRESEPYMTLSLAGTRRDAGVSIAEVNLKLIWDVVSKIKVGERGDAYVVDAQGRLIAHPEISLVLRNTDMTRLAQVQLAQKNESNIAAEEIQVATDIQGRQVLTAFAPVLPLGWTVFVELPVDEAYRPLILSMQRAALVLLAALCLAATAGMFLARRMVVPVQALRAGAARIGSGDLTQRISVNTGDELEALASQFNDMTDKLQESYSGLERKVALRTAELSTSLDELRLREHQLAAVSAEVSEKNTMLETLSNKLARYLPPQVYATIFSGAQDAKVVSQRKKLTIFFSDIVGFTETTDNMESEDLTNLLNQYLTEMSRIALDYGATIDKYIGDAVMVFFGDPESRGVTEDAIACVKMAVAMQKRIRQLAVIWRDSGVERPLTCRIGIHTGYCTVGNFGSDDRVSYTAVGGSVNLASRLENEAPPGEILMSYETYACVKEEVSCVEAARVSVKGLPRPIATYKVAEDFETVTDSEVVRKRLPYLTLNLDARRMTLDEQNEARQILEDALERLSTRPIRTFAKPEDDA